MKQISLYRRAISQWGYQAQIDMALEELLELAHAIMKFSRRANDFTTTKIEEEIADVEIMMAQLKLIFNKNRINKIKAKKKRRLQKRLEEGLRNSNEI